MRSTVVRAPPMGRRVGDVSWETASMATAKTPLGDIMGVELEGCQRYAGIRYARAPVGELRFRAPQPVEPWSGVYDATEFGPSAPQPPPLPGSFITAGELR